MEKVEDTQKHLIISAKIVVFELKFYFWLFKAKSSNRPIYTPCRTFFKNTLGVLLFTLAVTALVEFFSFCSGCQTEIEQ